MIAIGRRRGNRTRKRRQAKQEHREQGSRKTKEKVVAGICQKIVGNTYRFTVQAKTERL